MKFKVTQHAIDRLMQRYIDVESAKLVVRSPDRTDPTLDGKIKSTKVLQDGRELTIISVKVSLNEHVIITGYYAS